VETAREQPVAGRYHGLLTHSLTSILAQLRDTARVEARWIDIWSELLDRVAELNPSWHPQHPILVGRPERRIFGGAWQPQDPGCPVSRGPAAHYTIHAGSLMGVTVGAQIALYGPEPRRFPAIDSAADRHHRIGLLTVTQADRAVSVAAASGPVSWPARGSVRGRLVAPGVSERLRVFVDPPDPSLARFLEESALLKVCEPTVTDSEVMVKGTTQQGWIIYNDVTPEVARVPPLEVVALRAGLVQYAQYNRTLRLARSITALGDPEALRVDLLHYTDTYALTAAKDPHDPDLPVLAGVNRNSYILPTGTRFCVRVTNNHAEPLYVTVLNCEAFGIVDYMGQLTVRPGDHQVLWRAEDLRQPWRARPSDPSTQDRSVTGATDRFVIVGTTRPDVDLRYLAVAETVQDTVNTNIAWRGTARSVLDAVPGPAGPAELWTEQLLLVHIEPAVPLS
jgi:hypothetical protein